MQDNSIGSSSDELSDDNGNGSYQNGEVTASLASLAAGETPPAVGDEVELTVKGTVRRIEGDVACIEPSEVNGEPAQPTPENADSQDQGQSNEHDKLAAHAAKMDEAESYG